MKRLSHGENGSLHGKKRLFYRYMLKTYFEVPSIKATKIVRREKAITRGKKRLPTWRTFFNFPYEGERIPPIADTQS